MLTKDAAICIRAIDYSETSQVVTFFTRATGKLSTIAKGSKRPKSSFDGPIEIFASGNIVFSDSTREKLATLTEFEQKNSFTALAGDLFTLNCASLAAELLNQLTDDYDPHPELFDSFRQFLQNVSEARRASDEGPQVLVLLILFQLSLLKEIGLYPILNYCANCKTSHERRVTGDHLYFSSSANGLICKDCENSFPDKIKLSAGAANCLTNPKAIAESHQKTLNELEKILVSHFTYILDRPPRMAKYVLKA